MRAGSVCGIFLSDEFPLFALRLPADFDVLSLIVASPDSVLTFFSTETPAFDLFNFAAYFPARPSSSFIKDDYSSAQHF